MFEVPPEALPPDCVEVAPPELAPAEAPPVAVTYMTVGFDSTFSVFSPQPDPSQAVSNVPNKPKKQIRRPLEFLLEAVRRAMVCPTLRRTTSKLFLAH